MAITFEYQQWQFDVPHKFSDTSSVCVDQQLFVKMCFNPHRKHSSQNLWIKVTGKLGIIFY